MSTFPPPLTAASGLTEALRTQGFAVLDAAAMHTVAFAAAESLAPWWNDLPVDDHLKDGGHYRRRRHGSYEIAGAEVSAVPHRAHYQPVAYNALHGGIERWFAPLDPAMASAAALLQLLRGLGAVAAAIGGEKPFFAEVHPFRIATEGGIGRPTPEGAHRDGVDLVCVLLIARSGIKGGETRVFAAEGPSGIRFTLTEPGSALILDDARVIHETTPIQALDPAAVAYRDTLVVTLRAGGFQAR